MPRWRRRRYRVPCIGSGTKLTTPDPMYPDLWQCPACWQPMHRRADLCAPQHDREEVR
ncbi:hypothetical protein I5G63_gp080 [Mycobacterium phage Imvubu]|uniref:Uncharacterized protein n=1 Tax=Mycobacterium phage Imvubu TaxID=2686233 RepID=A0A6B9LA18_9CAUD|nr:hypothetical protein I5G63_gp080 [Mycobacterium phage Imvubu]QHB37843.1 hypothetical protein PBI_IMVUBU_80 [Mycobacterium phage Imvubu]